MTNRILQSLSDMPLTDDIIKASRAPFSGEYKIRHTNSDLSRIEGVKICERDGQAGMLISSGVSSEVSGGCTHMRL